jgi:hypothetical protein
MPAATPLPMRQRVFDLAKGGHDASHVAGLLSLPQRTARRLAARCRGACSAAGLAPRSPPGRPLAAARAPLSESCLRLRRENPGWGAGRIRVEMLALHPGACAPPRAPCSAGSKTPA